MKALNILLVEDDQIEIMKMKRVLATFEVSHHVTEVNNGEIALKYLQDTNQLPDIILLDLNMPRLNGLEFLEILKQNTRLKYLPVVILTTSDNSVDLKESFKTGVAGYILKPLKYEDYQRKIEALINYWSENELFKL